MARVVEFCDGAERGDSSWWSGIVNNCISMDSAIVIHGTYSYYLTGPDGNNVAHKTFSPMSELYFKCYIRVSSNGAGIRFRSGLTSLVQLAYNSFYSRWDITGGATGNTGDNSVQASSWQCLEVHYKISDTVGELTVKIDNAQVFTFSGDTKPGSETTVDNIAFLLGAMYIDDLALDTTEWCGLGYYVGLVVEANGSTNQWTPLSGQNYQNVLIPANDATYNSASLALTDEYALDTVDITGQNVLRVIPWARVKNPSGGTVQFGVRTYASNYTAIVATPVSFAWKPGDEYKTNPNTGNAWNQPEIDALQVHIQI